MAGASCISATVDGGIAIIVTGAMGGGAARTRANGI